MLHESGDVPQFERPGEYGHLSPRQRVIFAPIGPPLPIHLDPRYLRQTSASLQFEIVFKREPIGGDVLRFDQLQAWEAAHPKGLCPGIYWFIEAWERQLPEMPCPLKQQDGRLFYRLPRHSNGFEWEEDIDTPTES